MNLTPAKKRHATLPPRPLRALDKDMIGAMISSTRGGTFRRAGLEFREEPRFIGEKEIADAVKRLNRGRDHGLVTAAILWDLLLRSQRAHLIIEQTTQTPKRA